MEHGLTFDVLALDPRALHSTDPSRLEGLPRGTRVYGVADPRLFLDPWEEAALRVVRHLRRVRSATGASRRSRAPSVRRQEVRFRPLSFRSYLRAYSAARELVREALWARRAAAVADRIVERGSHCAVVTCGPPHLQHLGGSRIARRHGLPLVVDLRDPWAAVERLPEEIASPVWYRISSLLERRVIERSALVVANTDCLRESLQARYPAVAERVLTVMNGYDDGPLPDRQPGDRFLIAYAGTIYLDRNPELLFRAAARVVRELGLTPDRFAIEFMGHATSAEGVPVLDLAACAGLAGFVRVHPPATHRSAMEFLASASMLVNLAQDSHLAIPSKIFEYMRFSAWLVALAEPDSATERLLRGTPAHVLEPCDLDRLTAVVRDCYERFARGERAQPLACARPDYSRRAQAEHLFQVLESVLGGTAPITRTG